MTKCIYLAWQDQDSRSWHVVGKLLKINNEYEFRYTQGIKKVNNFSLLPSMPDSKAVYYSDELFSLFKNRLMPRSRPDYPNYLRWMGLTSGNLADELATLAISGGEKETDFFRIVPVPEKNINNEEYSFKFFANGISHMSDYAKGLVDTLQQENPLYLLHDFQNAKDKTAISLRTDDPPSIIGYVPAYLTNIIHKIREKNGFDSVKVSVAQVNIDAPFQKRLLCKLSSSYLNISWDEYEDEFKTLAP
jgi:hypothetical protein